MIVSIPDAITLQNTQGRNYWGVGDVPPKEGPISLEGPELQNVLNIKEYCENCGRKSIFNPHYPKKGLEKVFGTFYFRKKTSTI